jgi:hypothetical protein
LRENLKIQALANVNFGYVAVVLITLFFAIYARSLFTPFGDRRIVGLGSGEWGVGSGEWGVGSGEWGVGSGEWGRLAKR